MKNTLLVLFLSLTSLGSFAQNPCDEVVIESVTLNAFDMDKITVVVTNNSDELFSYPGFRIYNAETNELIGEELVNFFGIAQSSVHQISHNLGSVAFDDVFSIRLDLWTGFYEQLACQFELETVLRPSGPCYEVNIGANLAEISNSADTIAWELHDEEGVLIDTDGFILDPNSAFPYDVTCLLPGCYEVTFRTADNVANLGYMAYVFSEWFGDGGFSLVEAGQGETSFTFGFFEDCGIDGVAENELAAFELWPNPSNGMLQLKDVPANTAFNVYDMQGKLLKSGISEGVVLDLTTLRAGLYVLQLNGFKPAKFLKE